MAARHSFGGLRRVGPVALICVLGQLAGAAAAQTLTFRPSDPLNAQAFDHFYNLEYDQAVEDFQHIVQRHPDDAFAVNHLLTGVLFRELYRMGALNASDFANDSFVTAPHRPADPKVKQQVKDLVARAEQIEEKQLSANPKDADALYARGVTRAQYSTYLALMERAWFSALRNAVGARHDHERVLELNPSYTEAKLVVGAHNYVMGSLSWSLKAAVSMVGLGGNKEKGLQYLRDAAQAGGETSVDAKILLIVFLRRERQYGEALRFVRELAPRYPHDVLLPLEEANLLRMADHNAEAADAYRRVWLAGQQGRYAGLHYEAAALGLADLLRSQKNYAGAAAAYEDVRKAPQPDPEMLQKADLGAGEMYDLLQKRDLALKKYQAVLAGDANTPLAETARKHLKDPYQNN